MPQASRIKIRKPSANFTMVSNAVIRDPSLSLRAVGLYAYLVSLPNNTETSIERISKMKRDGRDSIRSARAELEQKGYLQITQQRKNGQFVCSVWNISLHGVDKNLEICPKHPINRGDPPRTGLPQTVKPEAVKPEAVEPEAVKPTTYNTDLYNTNYYKTKTTSRASAGEASDLLEQLVQRWNETAKAHPPMQQVKRLSKGRRRTNALVRLKDVNWVENYPRALQQIPKKAWRLGKNDRGWAATFEWFVRPDTVDSLIEESEAVMGMDKSTLRDSDLEGSFKL